MARASRASCLPISMYSRIERYALSLMTGPKSTAGSSGSPITSVRVDSMSRWRKVSYADPTTITREHAEHFWPW